MFYCRIDWGSFAVLNLLREQAIDFMCLANVKLMTGLNYCSATNKTSAGIKGVLSFMNWKCMIVWFWISGTHIRKKVSWREVELPVLSYNNIKSHPDIVNILSINNSKHILPIEENYCLESVVLNLRIFTFPRLWTQRVALKS